MSNLAIIPARGGSKRIPRKNIKEFLGLPIISYSIKLACESGIFDEIMVSTDDFEIAKIALSYGAKVPFMRSLENSSDMATTYSVIVEVLANYENKLGTSFDHVCCIYPCAPFILKNDLIGALGKLKIENLDTVFPVCKYSTPIQRALRINGQERIEFVSPQNEHKRSQDLESTYYDAGLFYWMKVKNLLINEKIVCSNAGAIILDEMKVQDIDNLNDWSIAEFKYNLLKNNS